MSFDTDPGDTCNGGRRPLGQVLLSLDRGQEDARGGRDLEAGAAGSPSTSTRDCVGVLPPAEPLPVSVSRKRLFRRMRNAGSPRATTLVTATACLSYLPQSRRSRRATCPRRRWTARTSATWSHNLVRCCSGCTASSLRREASTTSVLTGSDSSSRTGESRSHHENWRYGSSPPAEFRVGRSRRRTRRRGPPDDRSVARVSRC